MSGFELIARLTEALAWPSAALIIAFVLRNPIGQMLAGRPPRKVKAGPFEVEWDRVLAEAEKEVDAAGGVPTAIADELPGGLREELAAEAAITPEVAVLEAHANVERTLREMLASLPSEQTARLGAVGLARLASRNGLITPETANAIEGISVMRNLVAHRSAQEVTSEQALEYIALVDGVLYALRTRG